MSLTYSQNVNIKSFVASNQFPVAGKFEDDVVRTPEQRIDEINTKANNCRWWYEPTFADESKYLTPSSDTPLVVNVEQTKKPKKVEDDLLTALLVGAGIFVIYKLIS